jgi:hypothetical protein
MKTLVALLSFMWISGPTLSWAQPTKVPARPLWSPSIPAGTMIAIQSYDPETRTYHVLIAEEDQSAIGPNYIIPEDLLRALKTLDANELHRSPDFIVGNQYALDTSLRVLSQYGNDQRKKSGKKAPPKK